MDAKHYEKIADKLMQFRGKIPKNETLRDDHARFCCDVIKHKIDNLLTAIDHIAELDNRGLIR